MKLLHICLVARDSEALAAFYQTVFTCKIKREAKVIPAELVERGTEVKNSDVTSIWLSFSDCDRPFLEILEFDTQPEPKLTAVNTPGFGHLSFQVDDIASTLESILANGGSQIGELTTLKAGDTDIKILFVRDPEGNILELEEV
ncbi:VOC family protein [Roseibium sediminis]|uniref:VOC family protein n=1 Tax=Roseibium sediminis TaxID=1775174 RepID=UPI00123E11F0|nr:VOC family protein [Roseibium sediminis]